MIDWKSVSKDGLPKEDDFYLVFWETPDRENLWEIRVSWWDGDSFAYQDSIGTYIGISHYSRIENIPSQTN